METTSVPVPGEFLIFFRVKKTDCRRIFEKLLKINFSSIGYKGYLIERWKIEGTPKYKVFAGDKLSS